jgi:hypothetical protein
VIPAVAVTAFVYAYANGRTVITIPVRRIFRIGIAAAIIRIRIGNGCWNGGDGCGRRAHRDFSHAGGEVYQDRGKRESLEKHFHDDLRTKRFTDRVGVLM